MNITETGSYVTRDGLRVDINTVEVTRYTFPIKGHLITYTPTGRTRRTWGIWKVNGQERAVGEHPTDIIGTWAE